MWQQNKTVYGSIKCLHSEHQHQSYNVLQMVQNMHPLCKMFSPSTGVVTCCDSCCIVIYCSTTLLTLPVKHKCRLTSLHISIYSEAQGSSENFLLVLTILLMWATYIELYNLSNITIVTAGLLAVELLTYVYIGWN